MSGKKKYSSKKKDDTGASPYDKDERVASSRGHRSEGMTGGGGGSFVRDLFTAPLETASRLARSENVASGYDVEEAKEIMEDYKKKAKDAYDADDKSVKFRKSGG